MTSPAERRSKRDDSDRRVRERSPPPPVVIAVSLAPRLRSQLLGRSRVPSTACAVLLSALLTQSGASSPDAEFWRWFEVNARRLAAGQRPSEAVLDEIQRELQKAEPELAFELGYEGPGVPRV